MFIQINETLHFKTLNEQIRNATDTEIILEHCIGQRYIGAGLSDKKMIINGIPGNALGAYLNGSTIIVNGNAQDQTGDTMNDGDIVIHGSSGDATGYAMRGGRIFVRDNAGYRAGIHMKAYQDKFPVLVIGGTAGSFLGEYQAGGLIIVLGQNANGKPPMGYFCGTGMHGGKIFLRCTQAPENLPEQIICRKALPEDLESIRKYIESYCKYFNSNEKTLLNDTFYVLYPNSKNPYHQLYTYN